MKISQITTSNLQNVDYDSDYLKYETETFIHLIVTYLV